MSLPSDEKKRDVWLKMLGFAFKADDYSKSENNRPNSFKVAYWHFPCSRRIENDAGHVSLIDPGEPYTDNERKVHEWLVPINSLETALVELSPGRSNPKKR